MEYFKNTHTDLLKRLSDFSVIRKSGAEIIKHSLEAIKEQNKYIKYLTSSMQRKDFINLVPITNLNRSLDNFDDEDISIEVKKNNKMEYIFVPTAQQKSTIVTSDSIVPAVILGLTKGKSFSEMVRCGVARGTVANLRHGTTL